MEVVAIGAFSLISLKQKPGEKYFPPEDADLLAGLEVRRMKAL